jgi:glycine betaine/proline transport system permease protein
MNKISNLNLKIISAIIFVGLIVATYNLIIPKNIFYLFLKLVFFIPSVSLAVNIVNAIPKNLLSLLSKILGAVSLIILIIVSYLSSKRKPDNFGELFEKWDSFLGIPLPKFLVDWPKWLDTPFMHWINKGWKSFIADYGLIFDAIGYALLRGYTELKGVIVQTPWPIVIMGVIAITYFTSGKKIGTTVFVGFCTFFIGFLNPRFWDKAIETTTMVVIGIAICIIVGIPIGIAMARSEKVRNAILPILDTMQVIPAFCYLIPGIILFGLGAIPAIISIFIYACPPLIRLTDLGIRLVDKEVIEAARSFGASKKQMLLGVQLPLALPNIMQGINQCTMMALAMVVIASMIGTRGLGDEVLLGLQQLNVGAALEAGLAIVLLAIVLDRMTQAYGDKIQERTQPGKKKH